MKVILTEKPSVARDFARALGLESKNGYFAKDGIVVVNAFGHLLNLYEPHDYDPSLKQWSWSKLPIFPKTFRRKPVDAKAQKQLSLIRKLLKQADEVIIATDAEREGELIAREILEECGWQGKTLRFWTSLSLTPEVIRSELENLKPAFEFDRYYRAAFVRQRADWLVGINLSRAATLAFSNGTREVFSIGRVQTAVLALLVKRRRERENFKPQPYWVLKATFSKEEKSFAAVRFVRKDGQEETSIWSSEEARKLYEKVSKATTGKVLQVEKEKKREKPPHLYDLTELQRDAAKLYGFTAKKTLAVVQKLYENYKVVSYPRTESRYLGKKNFSLVRSVIQKLSRVYPEVFKDLVSFRLSPDNTQVFNDAKLTDHHAIIPLAPLPNSASQDERKIYDLILKRFAAVFYPDYEYEVTRVVIECAGEMFRARGKVPLRFGWRALYELKNPDKPETNSEESEDKHLLPPLEKSEFIPKIDVKLDERQTQPPPDYTENSLLAVMKNPVNLVEEDELKRVFRGDRGLGTQATRAEIIETLVKRGYVKRQGKKLIATDKGCFLIEKLMTTRKASVFADPAETARWEVRLAEIVQGSGNDEAFLKGIISLVKEGLNELASLSVGKDLSGSVFDRKTNYLGKCPLCGGQVFENKKSWCCSNWRKGCKFAIWKTIAGKQIPESVVRNLLARKTTPKISGFKSRSGKTFSARLKLSSDGKVQFVF